VALTGEELHGTLYIRYIDPYGAVMNGSATLVKATVLITLYK
jgi:hypothetical protein